MFLIVSALFFIILMAGLGIDLAALYVNRTEAQRSADAGALAGATYFVTSSCTSTTSGCSSVQTQATNEAVSATQQNLVGGSAPTVNPSSDVTFNWTPVNDPRITVTVHKTVPTFFMAIWGWSTVNVSAKATAEAYRPGADGPAVGSMCLKPWIFPNVDPNHHVTATPPANACPGVGPWSSATGAPADMTTANWCFAYPNWTSPQPNTFYSTFINPLTKQITNPESASSGGAIGEVTQLKAGSPSAAPAPSQWYPITIPPGSSPVVCPNCKGPGGGGSSTGANLYAQNIECCNTNTLTCGTGVVLNTQTGNMQGPTEQGVECLINESRGGGTYGSGQDTLCGTSVLTTAATCGPPFSYHAGSNNPFASASSPVTSTPSLATAPVYNGAPLTPGQSSGASSITVVGFIQFFVDGVSPSGGGQGNVLAHVINISACGAGGSGSGGGGAGGGGGGGGGGVITGGGIGPVPVRLVSQ